MFLLVFIKYVVLAVFAFFISLNCEIEKNIIYKPSKLMRPIIINGQLESFFSNDGKKLTYLHVKFRNKTPNKTPNFSGKNLPIIIFCHGNDGNVSSDKVLRKVYFLAKKGYDIYIPDYRGYGASQGTPNEKDIYSDIRSMIKHLQIKPENIVIWGHSLGAAIAIDAAKDIVFKGVIAEGGFTSIEDMRDYRLKKDIEGDPLATYFRNHIYNSLHLSQSFNSKSKIAKIRSPLMILHSQNDDVIPYKMSIDLYKLNTNAELYLSTSGNHNDTGWQNKAILEFIGKL